jgi:hypothetical protein
MNTDTNAIKAFENIRDLPLSHASMNGDRGCDVRAHKVAMILDEQGFENVEKFWIYSLPDPFKRENSNVFFPVHPLEEMTENKKEPFNIHVAPIITTTSGRELVFDTYFYAHPPALDQWLSDFKAFNPEKPLGYKRTDKSYLRFGDTDHPLPKPRIWYDLKAETQADISLRTLERHPLQNPLQAQWITDLKNISVHPEEETPGLTAP